MSHAEKIEVLVKSLKSEIPDDSLDTQSSIRLTEFETTIIPYLNTESEESHDSILEKAKRLEVDFAQDHPTAEGIMREIIATLERMGI